MWNPEGCLLSKPPWGGFPLDRVLLDYDGPRLLLRRSEAGQHYLAWWSDFDEGIERWVYLPISLSRLHNVLSGGMPTLDALRSPEDGYLLVVDEYGVEDQDTHVHVIDANSIPSEVLPSPGARLNLDIPDEITMVPTRDRAHMIDITLEAFPEDVGRVSSRLVGQFIGNLQLLLDALGQAAKGHPSPTGRISAEILSQTRLDFISSYVGSTGVRLETHRQDDLIGESIGRSAISALFGLMEAGSDMSKLTTQLQQYRGRVAKSYDTLLATIETSFPSATLRWAQSWQPKYRQISLSKEHAGEIRVCVQDVQTTIQDSFSVTGKLVMGSLRTSRFEIDSADDGRIDGTISDDAVGRIQSVTLGTLCQADLLPEIDVLTATGEEQTRYTLLDIRPVT